MKVVGFAGYSGSGKTTLVECLIPALKHLGQRVSVVKHAHHSFDIDHPGKDTFRHREAGAFEVVVASDRRLALIREFEREVPQNVHQLPQATLRPVFDLNDPDTIANWLIDNQARFEYHAENYR